MKIQDAEAEAAGLHEKAERDDDALLTVYFSRTDDKYRGRTTNMDAGDALLVVSKLIEEFDLSPEAIAGM